IDLSSLSGSGAEVTLDGDIEISAATGGEVSIEASAGDITLTAGDNVSVTASQGDLTLAGEDSVSITGDEVTVTASSIKLDGDVEITGTADYADVDDLTPLPHI
ncbi:hypothetical protein KIPB_015779, partial [Kipferlia bialata]